MVHRKRFLDDAQLHNCTHLKFTSSRPFLFPTFQFTCKEQTFKRDHFLSRSRSLDDYFVECPLAKENSAEGAILSEISSEKVSQYLSSHKFCICYFPVSKFDLLTCAQQTSLEPPHPGNKNRSTEIEILQKKASCFCLLLRDESRYRYRKSSKRPMTPAPHVPKIIYIGPKSTI